MAGGAHEVVSVAHWDTRGITRGRNDLFGGCCGYPRNPKWIGWDGFCLFECISNFLKITFLFSGFSISLGKCISKSYQKSYLKKFLFFVDLLRFLEGGLRGNEGLGNLGLCMCLLRESWRCNESVGSSGAQDVSVGHPWDAMRTLGALGLSLPLLKELLRIDGYMRNIGFH